MAQQPHEHIPIIKVTVESQEITEDDIIEMCTQYGIISRIKQLPNQNGVCRFRQSADFVKLCFL